MTINFKPEFAEKIRTGRKTTTIRQKNRYREGQTLQLYTGLRTKSRRKIADAVCLGVHPITLTRDGWMGVDLPVELGNLVELEGFDSWEAMRDWFLRQHGLPFEGYLIRRERIREKGEEQ